MAEQLYLSYWLRGFTEQTMLREFGRLLASFPFSIVAPCARVLRVYAFQFAEPALAEHVVAPEAEVGEILDAAREHHNPDSCFLLEAHWDLWQYDSGWRLKPSPVTLACFGPDFDNDLGDHLRVEAGLDTHFLPQEELLEGAGKVQSNIRGLLRLAHELDQVLPVEKRRLWSESGESFAERLQAALQRR